jgi:hypothetical protein
MAMTSEEKKAKREARKVFGMIVLDGPRVHLIGKGVICHGPVFKPGQENYGARMLAGITGLAHFPEHDAFVATEDDAPREKAKYVLTFRDEAARAAWSNAEAEGPTLVGPNLDVTTHTVWWTDLTPGHGFDGVARELEEAPAPKAKAKAKAKRKG